MAEYTNVAAQTVAANGNVLFGESPVACRSGNIMHREGSGIVNLRSCQNGKALYKVTFGANVAIPAGGAVEPISLAVAIGGEAMASSTMIVTPAAAGALNNVFTAALIAVPCRCCTLISVKNIGGGAVDVQNANLIVERIA